MSSQSILVTQPQAAGDGRARLIVLLGGDAGRTYAISNEAVIGRASDVDIRLTATGISRRHARIFATEDGEYIIEDLRSRNGTLVNGNAIEREIIHFGDKIFLGSETVLLFTYQEPLEDQLLQLQKMQAMGELAAGIAHDFNNLLGVVVASLEYLASLPRTGEFAREDVGECLDDATSASRRAAELTRQLLDFAKPSTPLDSTVDVGAMMDEVTKLATRTFDRSIEIETDFESRLSVKGDKTKLIQVLINLCINARDAMPDGGKLTLRTRQADRDDLGTVPVQSLGPHVLITVQDTGVGMDETTCSRIFEPFFTTKGGPNGSGLGLSTVYGIVRNHGGHIAVESEPGRGTMFKIFLPHARARSSVRATVELDSPTAVRRAGEVPENAYVLLVDDEDLVLRSTERLLRRAGYEVLAAASGREAISLYEKHRDDIRVVLLDLNMPEINGEETFHWLRQIDDEVKVILFSGYWDEGRVRRILEEGALAFVRKPADADTLRQALHSALEPEDSQSA